MRISRRALLTSLSISLATAGLYGLFTTLSQRKSYNTESPVVTQHMSKDEEAVEKAYLYVEGKGEVVGNLVAARLAGKGVEFFTFGEYFEAEPLITIVDPQTSILRQDWADGVSYRTISLGGAVMRDKLIAYKDTLLYVINNTSQSETTIKIHGTIQIFSWFMPQSRDIIAGLAGSKFISHSKGLIGSYSGNGPFIAITPSHKIFVNKAEPSHSNFSADLQLAPRESFILAVAGHHSSVEECRKSAEDALSNPETIEALKRDEVVRLVRAPTEKYPVKREYELLSRYLWYVILSNRAQVRNHPILTYPFVMPSKFALRHQWLWDSAFHAIILSKHNVQMAKEEILNLFHAQKNDGRIPHEIFLSREFCQIFWNVNDYAPWTTQPPVLAIAIDKIIEKEEDIEFMEKAYRALDRYDHWFRTERDADGDQLMSYVDYLESGWDDSVRWDEPKRLFSNRPEEFKTDYKQIRMAPVEAVDLNCLIYMQRKVLSKMAERIGLEREAQKYKELAETTARRVKESMWDGETGFYYDIYERDHKILRVKTPAAFLTLYSGIATHQQAGKLIQHLFNPKEFWTTFPLPSVSADDPNYNPKGYWRGRSWINIIWFTYHGLKTYGFEREATLLAQRVIDLMNKGPSCNENYNSQTGEPLGAPDFGWSALALELLN